MTYNIHIISALTQVIGLRDSNSYLSIRQLIYEQRREAEDTKQKLEVVFT